MQTAGAAAPLGPAPALGPGGAEPSAPRLRLQSPEAAPPGGSAAPSPGSAEPGHRRPQPTGRRQTRTRRCAATTAPTWPPAERRKHLPLPLPAPFRGPGPRPPARSWFGHAPLSPISAPAAFAVSMATAAEAPVAGGAVPVRQGAPAGGSGAGGSGAVSR